MLRAHSEHPCSIPHGCSWRPTSLVGSMAAPSTMSWDGVGRCPDGGLYERVETWYVCLLCNRRGADWAHCTSAGHVRNLIAHQRLQTEMQDELPQPPRPPQQQQLRLVWAQPDLGTAVMEPPPPPVEAPPPPPPQEDMLTLIQDLTTRIETLERRVAELTAALETAARTTSGWVDYTDSTL